MWMPNRTGRLLLLLISTCNFVIISGGNHGLSLPSIDVHDSVIRSQDVKNEVTNKIGAFEVKNLGEAYQKSMKQFFSQAPACLEKDTTLPKMVMNDGSVRTTFAKTSDSKLNPECLSEEIGVIAKAFDQVDKIVAQIIEDIVEPGTLRYQTSKDSGLIQDLSNSPVKQHLHVYTRKPTTAYDNKFMVPFHVDNGLYLLITPFPGHGLKIKTSSGDIIDTDDIKADSVLVLMGRGLTDWLLRNSEKSKEFYAVPHAVEALTSSVPSISRSIFARMKTAPLEAVPLNGTTKFKDVFFNEDISHDDRTVTFTERILVKRDMSSKHQGHEPEDHYSKATNETCNEGEAYCWMNCLPTKTCGAHQEMVCYSVVNNVTFCSDPNEECKTMDPTCNWECSGSDEPTDNEFCYGGMDMLMQGFETTKGRNPCIILFFKAWTLDSEVKFVFACFGVAVLGFLIEAIIAFRRRISGRRGFLVRLTPLARRFLVVTLFGLNLVLGYLAMLVAMTYSIELFICVVIGLMFGHFIFNTKSVIGESVDPCCASQNQQGGSSPNLAVNRGNGNGFQTISRTPCEPEGEMDSDHEELCCHTRNQQDEESGTRSGTISGTRSGTRSLEIITPAPSNLTPVVLLSCCGMPNCTCTKDRPPPYTQ